MISVKCRWLLSKMVYVPKHLKMVYAPKQHRCRLRPGEWPSSSLKSYQLASSSNLLIGANGRRCYPERAQKKERTKKKKKNKKNKGKKHVERENAQRNSTRR